MKSIYLFAGEQSGDNHGASLAKAIKASHPDWLLRGVAGPAMREQDVIGTLQMEQFAVMGITDVLKNLPRLIKLFCSVRDEILNLSPDAVVFIDYPAFNIRLAKALRNKGYKGKLVHYICPSVWAHGKGRIEKMARTLDLLLTIFPFEPAYFKGSSLPTKFVGNPVAESVNSYSYDEDWREKVGLSEDDSILALFPGSRKGEVSRNLPIQIKSAKLYLKRHPQKRIAISCANEELIEPIRAIAGDVALVPPQFSYELMRDSALAIATSGTVTLELALHKTPTVVCYKLTPFNRFIAKYLMRLNLPHYCIVNIIAGETVFPECIEYNCSPKGVAKELEFITNNQLLCKEKCNRIKDSLSRGNASNSVMREMETLLKC